MYMVHVCILLYMYMSISHCSVFLSTHYHEFSLFFFFLSLSLSLSLSNVRSHSFAIRPRPENIEEGTTIYNLNVRGKRGNIVQVYPGVEYDFVPNVLHASNGAYIHVQ